MPAIGRVGSVDVMIFRNDHDPLHFHLLEAESSARLAAADCELMPRKDRIRWRDLRDVEAWAHG
jgi:hypothetical protein